MFPEPMKQCRRVVTHWNPHRDEMFAHWQQRKFGQTMFPGILKATLVFRKDTGLFEGKIWQQHWVEGTSLLGTGGGLTDEHPFKDEPRKEGECCASLMAKVLGIEKDPAIKAMVDDVKTDDLKGQKGGLSDLSRRIRAMYLYTDLTQEDVASRVLPEFDLIYKWQRAFWRCGKEIREEIKSGRAFFEKLPGYYLAKGEEAVLVAVASENPEISTFCLHKKVGIVIIKSPSTGNAQILFSKKFRHSWDRVAAAIRYNEAKIRKRAIDPIKLTQMGTVDFAQEWEYIGWALLNGSRSYPDIPPTILSLAQLVKCVKLALGLIKK